MKAKQGPSACGSCEAGGASLRMAGMDPGERMFFVAGGTVPGDSPSYVERAADGELFEALRKGEYCYVLNSRQMGKSSLAVRTLAKLKEADIRTAFIDLTRIGGPGVTPDQWFAGLIVETGRVLGLRSEAVSYLREQKESGPAQRFLSFIQEIALPVAESPLVVMIDEVDAVRSLSFSTDAFFAGMRQLHNGRASEVALNRLTFCLLGAALPSDLIRDPRTTPFNIGRRIELRDFTFDEAEPFARALGPDGRARLGRVFYWTKGHPFLTQALCQALSTDAKAQVDSLVQERYLEKRARDSDTNLADVGNRILGSGDPEVGDRERSDTLSQLSKLLKGGIPDDESNPAAARIKMSGVARLEAGRLNVRNRIYASVFEAGWIRENMPGQELQRQRRAFWRGVLRTASIAFAIILVISTLAVIAVQNAHRAETLERKARYDRYVALMRNMNELRGENNLELIRSALNTVAADPWKGWEWDFWNRIANRAKRTIQTDPDAFTFVISPDGRLAVSDSPRTLEIFDMASERPIGRVSETETAVTWLRDSRHYLAGGPSGDIRLFDATGKVVWDKEGTKLHFLGESRLITLPGDRAAVFRTQLQEPILLNPATGEYRSFSFQPPVRLGDAGEISRDGRVFAFSIDETVGETGSALGIADPRTWKISHRIELGDNIRSLALTADGRTVFVGTRSGHVLLVDSQTGEKKDLGFFFPFIYDLDVSRDGRKLMASGASRASVLLELRNKAVERSQIFRESGCAGFMPGDKEVFTLYDWLSVYDAESEPETPSFRVPLDRVQGYVTPNGQFVGANGDQAVRVPIFGGKAEVIDRKGLFPVASGQAWLLTRSHSTTLLDGSFKPLREVKSDYSEAWASPDGRSLAVRIDANDVGIFAAQGSAPPVRIPVLSGVSAMTFSQDGSLIAVAYYDGRVSLYRTSDGKSQWSNLLDNNAIDVSFSPDGTRLAACGYDDRGTVWDLRSGKTVVTLVGHSQAVMSLAWSPDGTRIATGSSDTTVRLWDAASGACLGIIGSHDQEVPSVQFLNNGRTLASFSVDGVVKLWMTGPAP